jgi:iron-sulfur cluster repair protein YtfE (RIC family)
MSEVPVSPRTRSGATDESSGETDQIMAEHEMLKEVLGRLDGARDIGALAALLGDLEDLLEVHFAREERADGILRDVGARAPHRVDALAEVLSEHDELRRAAAELAQDARACLEGPIQALYDGVHELRARLQSHEARENEIFLDALYTDYGTGD